MIGQNLRGMIAALLASFPAAPLCAASLKIFPVRLLLTQDEPVQTMTIANSSDTPTRVQLHIYSWRQDGEEDRLEETREVLANPGQFEIPAGGTQIARFGLRTGIGPQEKSYRVILEEIPGMRAALPGQVETLLRVSIPIFVPPSRPSGRLSWRAWPSGNRNLTLAIRNDGNAHVQINRLSLTKRNRREVGRQDMSTYLLPGSERRVTVPLGAPVAAGEALTVIAMTDQAEMSADLVTEGPRHEEATP
ncbi:P pilus assembly protein, chaperone PapD [Sphingobium indicum UT26S]|uniref:P pilus assembly protein, chaperone PapD n=2 Tax=Sphingomonadaceae TaxID=41297 RepID=D4YYV7_SPHIU|nr:P pilus assembly protein, chaperone PapD [Sphingobium indicum UT26S]